MEMGKTVVYTVFGKCRWKVKREVELVKRKECCFLDGVSQKLIGAELSF